MLKILVPDNLKHERSYAISALINMIELDYSIEFEPLLKYYEIHYNDFKLVINDSFFIKFNNNLSYLSIENIPQKVCWFNNTLPIIYGENYFIINEKEIYCGIDVFASAYFMLTRWEEYVVPNKDKFGRCNEDDMFVVKHGIYNRPIVDEYVELLKNLLTRIGVELPIPKNHFSVSLTHHVDYLFRYANFNNFIKNLAGDILNRKSLPTFFSTLYNYILFKFGKRLDPFDTFDEIMDLSESIGVRSAFYFKAAVKGEYDYTYNIFDKRVVAIMNNIVRRGHEVGIHPSKNTFRNPDHFRLEVERMRSIGFSVNGGRQHFLLYDLPYTLRTWSENGLLYDAGLGFAFRAGFRCGTSHEYNYFDFLKREVLPIKIRPLICMEGALFDYQKERSMPDIEREIIDLVDKVHRYNGCFVFLWHNDRFYRPESLKTVPIYRNVLTYLSRLQNE